MTQLSLFPEYLTLVNQQPNDSICLGEVVTAFSRDMGWIRVEAGETTNTIQSFRVDGGRHDGAIITRDFLWIFVNT